MWLDVSIEIWLTWCHWDTITETRFEQQSDHVVATLSIWSLVDAADESTAREAALPGLHKLYAEAGSRIGRDFPIEIVTVRPAAPNEIAQWLWHHEIVSKHDAK